MRPAVFKSGDFFGSGRSSSKGREINGKRDFWYEREEVKGESFGCLPASPTRKIRPSQADWPTPRWYGDSRAAWGLGELLTPGEVIYPSSSE